MANLTVEEDGGGDYTTLDEACDNITATDTITIQAAWDNPDTRAVIVSVDCNITATGTARISTSKHVAGVPTHYRLHVADGNHCITVNDSATTIDGIEVKQNAGGPSDECIRMAHDTGTLTIKNCILFSANSGNDQDAIHTANINCTINLENCIIYNMQRAGILEAAFSGSGRTITININSSGFYLCGENSETLAGGISTQRTRVDTVSFNIHNVWVLACSFDSNNDYNQLDNEGTITWGISYSIDSDNSIASRDGGGAGNQASRSIFDSDQGAGNNVIVNDITGSIPFDLSLLDLSNANNNAQDEHSTASAEGLTIPATDIDGTSRPQNTNFDIGAFEIVSGGAALFASIADTVGITDTITTKVGSVRSIADTVGISDIITKIGTYIRTLADNLAITDTINTARNLKKSLTDDVGITDTIATKKFVLVALADTVGITDVLTKIGTYIRNIADTVSISDSLTAIVTFFRNLADTIGITDVITSEKFVLVALADTVGITDVLTKIGTFIRNIPEGVGITDVLTKIGTYKRSITDTSNITDTTTTTKGVFRSVADSVGITDIVSAIVGKVASIADSIGITDAITFIKTTVFGGRVFIVGIAKSLRISSKAKSLRISGEDKSLRISGEPED